MSLSPLTAPENLPKPLLRLLPPPRWLALGLRLVPPDWTGKIMARYLATQVFSVLPSGSLDFLAGHSLAVEVEDLGLRFVLATQSGKLVALPAQTIGEALIRGNALDLLLLASQLEDADTLFFQRRLVMTGNTALGLETRNLLDQLPWERLNPGLRIILNRMARLAQAAREARH